MAPLINMNRYEPVPSQQVNCLHSSVQQAEVATVSAGHSRWLLQGQSKAQRPGREGIWTEVFIRVFNFGWAHSTLLNGNVTFLQGAIYMSNEALLPKIIVFYTIHFSKSRVALRRENQMGPLALCRVPVLLSWAAPATPWNIVWKLFIDLEVLC